MINIKNKNKIHIIKYKNIFIKIFLFIFSFTIFTKYTLALEPNTGKSLFDNNCSGCHLNGSNIIRRSKNLKISTLKKNGIFDKDAIAKIAREGIGIMNGYEKSLGEKGDLIVASWILEKAQKAWVQE